MSSRRYTERETAEIIRSAAEGLGGSSAFTQEGVSEQELRAAAGELGIDPRAIDSALSRFDQRETGAKPGLFGQPFRHESEHVFEGSISDDQWEEILPEIRRAYGETGKLEIRGSTYEWVGTGGGAQSTTFTIRQSGGTVRIKATTDLTTFAQGAYTFLIFPVFLTMGLATKLGWNPSLLALLALSVSMLWIVLVRTWLANSSVRLSERQATLVERARNMLESEAMAPAGEPQKMASESPSLHATG